MVCQSYPPFPKNTISWICLNKAALAWGTISDVRPKKANPNWNIDSIVPFTGKERHVYIWL